MQHSSKSLDAATIRARLAGTEPPEDPRFAALPTESARWPRAFLERAKNGLTPAGVLIPLLQRADGIAVLLTERSSELKIHAGQVSFPGGRMEAGDANITATALRETAEEVGIPAALIDVLGYLPPSPTVTNYTITPVIGLVGARASVTIDPMEVATAFEVPLAFLMDDANRIDSVRDFQGVEVPIIEYHYAGQRIWGATATIIMQLKKVLYNSGL